jgi:hypothetical protein
MNTWRDEEQYRLLYKKVPLYGKTGSSSVNKLKNIIENKHIDSVWDFGCGINCSLINELKKIYPRKTITGYDPAAEVETSMLKNVISMDPVDMIVSTDCLEHLWEDEIDKCFEIFNKKFPRYIYLVISTRLAKTILPNGTNAHKTVKSADWWRDKLNTNFQNFKISQLDVDKQKEQVTILLEKI